MQKDTVKALILVVLEQIVIKVGEDKIYSIVADECTNISGNKLMTVVIQYVNYLYLSGQISERIIGTIKVDDTTAQKKQYSSFCVGTCQPRCETVQSTGM